MNRDNLHALIGRYEDALPEIYGSVHWELFKWKAMKTWQEEWNRPADAFPDFGARFAAAKRDFGLFTDNSRMHPSAGLLKIWEKEPDTVERLFTEVLLGDAGGDVKRIQDNTWAFLDGYEALRMKYYPRNWGFKQDGHSASVYLAVNDPEANFVFKARDAREMARYIGFEQDLGAGLRPNLVNYYRMGEEIVAALEEHDTLLEKHRRALKEGDLPDRGLRLLAFDLTYCSLCYGFYTGLSPVGTPGKKGSAAARKNEEEARRAAEKQEQIEALEREIAGEESKTDDCEDISLLGVQVTAPGYGEGVVVGQDVDRVEVQFADKKVAYRLGRQYKVRPRFEDDETLIDAFTAYGLRQDRIRELKKRLKKLKT